MATALQETAYGLTRTVPWGYDEAVERITAALAEVGFGVLTRIDVKATLKQKLDVDFEQYVILGACNPKLAHRVLTAERELGLLLPCNVIVYVRDGQTQVAAMSPMPAMTMTGNRELEPVAAEADRLLRRCLEGL